MAKKKPAKNLYVVFDDEFGDALVFLSKKEAKAESLVVDAPVVHYVLADE